MMLRLMAFALSASLPAAGATLAAEDADTSPGQSAGQQQRHIDCLAKSGTAMNAACMAVAADCFSQASETQLASCGWLIANFDVIAHNIERAERTGELSPHEPFVTDEVLRSIYLSRGKRQEADGNIKAAIGDFLRAEASTELATLYYREGEPELAFEALSNSKQAIPENLEAPLDEYVRNRISQGIASYERGQELLEKGKANEAIDHFYSAVSLLPQANAWRKISLNLLREIGKQSARATPYSDRTNSPQHDLIANLTGKWVGSGEGLLTAMIESHDSNALITAEVTTMIPGQCFGTILVTGTPSTGSFLLTGSERGFEACALEVSMDGRDALHVEEIEGCYRYHGAACGFSGRLARTR